VNREDCEERFVCRNRREEKKQRERKRRRDAVINCRTE
jgi:hypothetical protein